MSIRVNNNNAEYNGRSAREEQVTDEMLMSKISSDLAAADIDVMPQRTPVTALEARTIEALQERSLVVSSNVIPVSQVSTMGYLEMRKHQWGSYLSNQVQTA